MDVPIEILQLFVLISMPLSLIGIIKKAPVAMFISGAMLAFLFLLVDNVTSLGATQTCTTTLPSTTSCTFSPYPLDAWVKILFCLLGSVFMIVGAVIWKGNDE